MDHGATETSLAVDSAGNILRTDSLRNSADSIQRSKWSEKNANQKYDSIQHLVEKQNKLTSAADTIAQSVNAPVAKANNLVDTLHRKAQNFIDSKMDSIRRHIENPIDKVNTKVSDATRPLEEKATNINRKIEAKTDKVQSGLQKGFDKATDGNVKAPVQSIEGSGIDIPGGENGIQGVDLSTPDVPGVNGDLHGVTNLNDGLKLPDNSLNADQLKEKLTPSIPETGKVNEIKNEMGNVDSKLAEAEKYGDELQGIKKMDSASVDNMGKKIEDKVTSLDEVKGIEEQKQVLTEQQLEYKAMMQRYQDKKLLKDEIARKSRNVVNGKIDKLTPSFKEAQEKIDKAKKLNPNVEQYKGQKIKRANEMSAAPLRERLVPGITLQVYNKDVFTIDWGMQLGYKFSSRLLAGVGGVYRMEVSESYNSLVKSAGIYGYRSFININLVKGFYALGEFESLHANAFFNPQTQAEVKSQQVHNGYFGLGKKYDISRKIRGSAIVLYRAEFEGDLPSASRINLRIGFDYNLKKRKALREPKVNQQ